MNLSKLLIYLALAVVLTLGISACGSDAPSGTYVWIDVPLDGIRFKELVPVDVEGHASSRSGIKSVEVYVDGELWRAVEDPASSGSLAIFEIEWLPPEMGTYLIQAIAYGEDGSASQYDEARITFSKEEVAEEAADTTQITVTPAAEETLVEFWAEPAIIQAGDCTTIRWQAENVAGLIFGGQDQPLEGSYQDCLCAAQTYTLTVNHSDGSQEKLKVNIEVEGTCADTASPSVPEQVVPDNGISLSCRGTQNLAWQPVSDPSGISGYRVQAQRHSGDKNWKEAPGSQFVGIGGKQISIPVECGWTYRWRVQAVDGAGYASAWSGWWRFIVNLE